LTNQTHKLVSSLFQHKSVVCLKIIINKSLLLSALVSGEFRSQVSAPNDLSSNYQKICIYIYISNRMQSEKKNFLATIKKSDCQKTLPPKLNLWVQLTGKFEAPLGQQQRQLGRSQKPTPN